MKILQVIDNLDVGGAERVFVDMCNILHENNHNVTALLLLTKNGELASQLQVPFIKLDRKSKWNVSKMYRCYKIMKQYDIVHCHFRHVYTYMSIVNLIFNSNSKIILQDHYGSINIDKKIPFLLDSILKPSYYIGVSNTLRSWSIKYLKIEEVNVFLLSNIVRKKRYSMANQIEVDFILVSNIKPVKNNLFAVELCQYLKKTLLLVGQIQDKEYYSKIKTKLDDTISISTLILDSQEICRKAKFGLHTSKSESGPLVLIEYLAQGLPFLSYETGEVATILKPHFPEYFIDNFDMQEWKSKLDKIIKLDVDYTKMNTVFEQYFGEVQYYRKLENIYACILKD
ncbi:glycosyltransferase [Flavobacterium tegetincola]|uniref:glycosyltransferase n=1 Tax=Flavobacterium tegetincola TaxID=150172 RepID=UPI0004041C23|nr:glycosyltransferase [Flavobacterium tegetincola]